MTRTIPNRESLTVEFKSDLKRLSDQDLIMNVVCLANSEGGEIYLGVEDNGKITGTHPDHQDVSSLAALIANKTLPPISVRVILLFEDGHHVARIEVPKSQRLVASSSGTLQRRRIKADGTPECIPFLPYEFASRESDLGLIDYSALPVRGATLNVLDSLERVRLRQMIERYNGDKTLLGLDDSELDGALGLIRSDSGQYYPTVTGLLLLGKESALRMHLPTHEVAFQVLEGTDVRVNDFYRLPLLAVFERVEEQFSARYEEEELQVGLFRVPIPNFDRRAFREALLNALTHRDYTRLGAVYVRWEQEALNFSNPGGFVEGVTLENILVVEPSPRNPTLADALKRIGLVERTGRGIDLIYKGLLRYGRPAPDYSSSNSTSVVVRMQDSTADLPFLRMILEEEQRTKAPIPVDALITLSCLRDRRRTDATEIAKAIQKNANAARAVLERLVEVGLVEPFGVRKERTYTLSKTVYRQLGHEAGYVRQAGISPNQQEQLVLELVRQRGQIRRLDVIELCKLGPSQAKRLLQKLTEEGKLILQGERRAAFYERGPNL